jgi:hypothetical protein
MPASRLSLSGNVPPRTCEEPNRVVIVTRLQAVGSLQDWLASLLDRAAGFKPTTSLTAIS